MPSWHRCKNSLVIDQNNRLQLRSKSQSLLALVVISCVSPGSHCLGCNGETLYSAYGGTSVSDKMSLLAAAISGRKWQSASARSRDFLTDLHHAIVPVDEDHAGHDRLFVIQVHLICEGGNDDQIARLNQMGRSSVGADVCTALFAFNCIGFQTCAPGHVPHMNRFIAPYIRSTHQVRRQCQRTFIVKVSLGYGSSVDLRAEKFSMHGLGSIAKEIDGFLVRRITNCSIRRREIVAARRLLLART